MSPTPVRSAPETPEWSQLYCATPLLALTESWIGYTSDATVTVHIVRPASGATVVSSVTVVDLPIAALAAADVRSLHLAALPEPLRAELDEAEVVGVVADPVVSPVPAALLGDDALTPVLGAEEPEEPLEPPPSTSAPTAASEQQMRDVPFMGLCRSQERRRVQVPAVGQVIVPRPDRKTIAKRPAAERQREASFLRGACATRDRLDVLIGGPRASNVSQVNGNEPRTGRRRSPRGDRRGTRGTLRSDRSQRRLRPTTQPGPTRRRPRCFNSVSEGRVVSYAHRHFGQSCRSRDATTTSAFTNARCAEMINDPARSPRARTGWFPPPRWRPVQADAVRPCPVSELDPRRGRRGCGRRLSR